MACTISKIELTDAAKIDGRRKASVYKYIDDIVGNNTKLRNKIIIALNNELSALEDKDIKNVKSFIDGIKDVRVAKAFSPYGSEHTYGFSDIKTVSIASNHAADIIKDTHNEMVVKSSNGIVDKKDVVKKVIAKMENTMHAHVKEIISKDGVEETDNIKEYNRINAELKELQQKAIVQQKIIKDIKSSKEVVKEAKLEIKKILDDFAKLSNKRYAYAFNIIQENSETDGNVVYKNYANLVFLMKTNEAWIDKVFNNKKLFDIREHYQSIVYDDDTDVLDNIEEEQEDGKNDDDGINTEAHRWNNIGASDYMKLIDNKLRSYFDTLYELASPYNPNGEQVYNTDNNLGVRQTIGANFIISQIMVFADRSSVDNFIKSLEKASKNNKKLYVLGKVVADMRADKVFANYVFHQMSNPIVAKTMVIMDKHDVRVTHSNRASIAIAKFIDTSFNVIRSSYKTIDTAEIKDKFNKFNNTIQSTISSNKLDKAIKQIDNNIDNLVTIVRSILPNVSKEAIVGFLDNDNKINNYKELSKIIPLLLRDIDAVNKTYNDEKENAIVEKRSFDYNNVNFDKVNQSIINFAKLIVNYETVRTELNSQNAEGNQSSDSVNNSYISNLMTQLTYKEGDRFVGLENMLEFFTKNEKFYAGNPILFGVTDANGNFIREGLFVKNKIGEWIVNPNADEVLRLSLFNGVRDNANYDGITYSKMSKIDYFYSSLILFNKAVGNTKGMYSDAMRAFMLRTPSDAPKNYMLHTKPYDINGMFSVDKAFVDGVVGTIKGLFGTIEDVNNKINNVLMSNYSQSVSSFAELLHEVKNPVYNKFADGNKDYTAVSYKLSDNVTVKAVFQILSNQGVKIKKFDKIYIVEERKEANDARSNTEIINGVRKSDDVNKLVNDIVGSVVKDTTSNKAVKNIVSYEKVAGWLNVVVENTVKNQAYRLNKFGINDVSKNTEIFRAFYQHVDGEVNNLIDQLNNVFEFDGVRWVLKKDTTGLFDNFHVGRDGLFKDGKLTGNVFKVNKLFTTGGVNHSDELLERLSLYGQDGVIKTDNDGTVYLDIRNEDGTIKDDKLVTEVESNGERRLTINKPSDYSDILNETIGNFITHFSHDSVLYSKEFEHVYEDNYKVTDIIEWSINSLLNNYNLDALLEGHIGFYKSSRDFFKRAKEVQAGGKNYSNFSFSDKYGEVKDIIDENGAIVDAASSLQIVPKGSESVLSLPLSNSFRAVTIKGTNRGSRNNMTTMIEDLAKSMLGGTYESNLKKATEIIAPYFGSTKVNDAQSYITIEEFIRRKFADGTLNEYKDILEYIYSYNGALEDFDYSKLKGLIQVQKNFYYDVQYDDKTKSYYPRQIKNAEFVIIPQLLKDGSPLKELYNVMVKHNIAQVNTSETSKAANKNVIEFWDNEGNHNAEKFEDGILNQDSVGNYFYRYLYKQQDVSEHMKDTVNKAGVQIMKKLSDNLFSVDAIKFRDMFFENYSANIEADYNDFIHEMGWKEVDGVILNIDGSPITFEKFYEKAKREAIRLGLNDNFMKLLTPDENGIVKYPNYFGNVSSKFMSVAQSMFNSSIRRQKLPGWHAAQVSSLGTEDWIFDENGNKRYLKYHPAVEVEVIKWNDGTVLKNYDEVYKRINSNFKVTLEDIEKEKGLIGTAAVEAYAKDKNLITIEKEVKHEAYAEIMIPRWSNLIPKGYDIKKLEEEGLDIQIGYRIPTEGKQSVSIFKVVGFADDAYGSTVFLPDEWVTQTGADFDVDSVYAMTYEMFMDKNGTLRKVKDDDNDENSIKRRYVDYVKSRVKLKEEDDYKGVKDVLDEQNKIIKDSNSVLRNNKLADYVKEIKTIIDKLPENVRNSVLANIKASNDNIDKSNPDYKKLSIDEQIKYVDDIKELYKDNTDVYNNLVELNKVRQSISNIFGKKHEAGIAIDEAKSKIEEVKQRLFDVIDKIGVKNGLYSYKDFAALPNVKQVNKRVRNNRILDAAVEIMKHPDSRVENYSRSNFDKLVDGKKIGDEARGANARIESPYNPLNQIDYMYDAMSGASLKATSVTYDNFASIAGVSQMQIEKPISVVYNADEYNIEDIAKSYPNSVISEDGKSVTVNHNYYGWSENYNRNVVGELITPYSSQTTAHILDAVKEGSIYNENMFTFPIFKNMVSLGIDYDTAIAFLMQPAVTDIVAEYNNNESVFLEGGNPAFIVNTVLKSYVAKLDGYKDVNQYSKVSEILERLRSDKRFNEAWERLFFAPLANRNDTTFIIPPLNKNKLLERITRNRNNQNNASYDDIVYDIAMLISYGDYNKISNKINNALRISSPDRVGAKQTIEATRKILEDVEKGFNDDFCYVVDNGVQVNFLQALFPDYYSIATGDFSNKGAVSTYPYMNSFFNSVTIPSVKINSRLFDIESDNVRSIINAYKMIGGVDKTADTIERLKKFIIKQLSNGSPAINKPVTIDGNNIVLQTITDKSKDEVTRDEIARIFGYNFYNKMFTVEDINNITEEELAEFTKLTPAQKVVYIKKMFDDGGLFDVIDVNLFNSYEYNRLKVNRQTISFSDQNIDLDDVIILFNEAYNSSNPLVRLAAFDIIKYAFVVEGFSFGKGNVSKIIPFETLDDTHGVLQDIKTSFDNVTNDIVGIINSFVRSNPDTIRVVKLNGNSSSKKEAVAAFNEGVHHTGVVFINENIGKALNIPRDGYVKIERKGKDEYDRVVVTNITYKVTDYNLYPINTLERDEHAIDVSFISANNRHGAPHDYEALIEEFNNSGVINPSVKVDKVAPRTYFGKYNPVKVEGLVYEDNAKSTLQKQINKLIDDYKEAELKDSKSISGGYKEVVIVKGDLTDKIGKKFVTTITDNNNDTKTIKLESSGMKRNSANIPVVIYKVTDVKNNNENNDISDEAEDVANSEIGSIVEEYKKNYIPDDFTKNPLDDIQMAAKRMLEFIYRKSHTDNQTSVDTYRNLLNGGVEKHKDDSIKEKETFIYKNLSEYFVRESNRITSLIDEYEVADGTTYSIDDEALYEYFVEHPEEFERFSTLILDAMTFAKMSANLFDLSMEEKNEEIANAVNKIRHAVTRINTNTKLKKAITYIFEKYLAKSVSTNPNLANGISSLREAFGDVSWFDKNFSDIGELNHKQIQVIVKKVNGILNEARNIEAVKLVDEFYKKFDEIVSRGQVDFDKIITKDGKFIKNYTDELIKDRDKHNEAVFAAKERFDNARESYNSFGDKNSFEKDLAWLEYKKAFVDYENTKIARDKWYVDNIEQEVVEDYYKEDIRIREEILKKAPDEYMQYLIDTAEIKDIKNSNLSKEDKSKKIKAVRDRIYDRHFGYMNDGFPDIVDAIRKYAADRRVNYTKYFEFNEVAGFEETLKGHLDFMAKYEKEHPDQNLNERLTNQTYKIAYDWIGENTMLSYDEDTKKALDKAYAALNSKNPIGVKNEYEKDAHGIIDGRKVTPDEAKEVKARMAGHYGTTGSIAGSEFGSVKGVTMSRLYKEVPAQDVIYTTDYSDGFTKTTQTKLDEERKGIVIAINKLLIKGIDKYGHINTEQLFENLSEDEIAELSDLYDKLKSINKKIYEGAEFSNKTKRVINQTAFDREFNYYNTTLISDPDKAELWKSIFVEKNDDGSIKYDEKTGLPAPNPYMFGYIVPVDDKYIDTKKTEAYKLLKDNVVKEPTVYYHLAMEEASKAGKYQEWFDANHVFNPRTRRYEPLSFWLHNSINPNGSLKGSHKYIPTHDNTVRNVREEHVNPNYKEYAVVYKPESGNYGTNVTLTDDEVKMIDLLQGVINHHSSTFAMKKFAQQGYLPRRGTIDTNALWVAKQVFGAVGLQYQSKTDERFTDNVEYLNDYDPEFDMMTILKTKGYREKEQFPHRRDFDNVADYNKEVQRIRKVNAEIEKSNAELESKILDRDWRSVMGDFITKAVEYNARKKVKNLVFLTIEDLKSNSATSVSNLTGKVQQDRTNSTDGTPAYKTVNQDNAVSILTNWARRVLYQEFKKPHKLAGIADMMQNITSAKYMIFNVKGGVANLFTGYANILNEYFGGQFFDKSHFAEAEADYLGNMLSVITDAYSEKSDNKTVAWIKLFDIVDFDAFNERRPGEKLHEYSNRIRNGLYIMQSGGEHHMQNVVLMSMIKSHKIYKNAVGKFEIGSYNDYIRELERAAMIKAISTNSEYKVLYERFIDNIRNNKESVRVYDEFRRSINKDFIKYMNDENLTNTYLSEVERLMANAEKEFNASDVLSFESQFEHRDGRMVLKKDAVITGEQFGMFVEKVKSVNKMIHGVYDKIGAAQIEKEWWGSLVMQYHKHLYPGFKKRYRRKGYWNEVRQHVERGTYVTAFNLLTEEFTDFKKRYKNRINEGDNVVLASIKEVISSGMACIRELRTNYKLMDKWERDNLYRCLGDVTAIMSAFMFAIALYGLADDDEIKEDNMLGLCLYLSDRLMAESYMWSPQGAYTEAKTLWSSPIAAKNGVVDLLKIASVATNILIDDDYNPNYTTGLYKGENKMAVLAYRNAPIYRIYNGLANISKHNNYYKLGEREFSIKAAKDIADVINPD